MENQSVYQKLAKKLDSEVVIGAPMSPSLIEILKVLFTGEEADIALNLPFAHLSLSDLKKKFPEKSDALEDILKRMAQRGTVYTETQPGKEAVYSLLPTVVGFAETPFWSGKENEDTRKLSPLWLQYRKEAFGEELARGIPAVRVVPIAQSLKDSSQVLPFDQIKDKLEKTSFLSVAHCPCRQMMRQTGKGCDHSTENCLHFGTMGQYMVKHGMAREITQSEALDVLNKADDEGLVHICDNMEGHLSTICNCCSCCCVFLSTKSQLGLQTYSTSNYVSSVDEDLCVGCGTCEDRCPVGAISLGGNGFSSVNPQLCIGCGVCAPTCDSEAIGLIQRENVTPPPSPEALLMARYKP
ncbi:MAG: (4Fe-4S)-binding protein [Desulfobacterium sp.]|nr:(4Fe-4S)-binding protein [Desulfobacterium sp.]